MTEELAAAIKIIETQQCEIEKLQFEVEKLRYENKRLNQENFWLSGRGQNEID